MALRVRYTIASMRNRLYRFQFSVNLTFRKEPHEILQALVTVICQSVWVVDCSDNAR